jgi:hypothetical protein
MSGQLLTGESLEVIMPGEALAQGFMQLQCNRRSYVTCDVHALIHVA